MKGDDQCGFGFAMWGEREIVGLSRGSGVDCSGKKRCEIFTGDAGKWEGIKVGGKRGRLLGGTEVDDAVEFETAPVVRCVIEAHADDIHFVVPELDVRAVQSEFGPAVETDIAAIEQQLRASVHIVCRE